MKYENLYILSLRIAYNTLGIVQSDKLYFDKKWKKVTIRLKLKKKYKYYIGEHCQSRKWFQGSQNTIDDFSLSTLRNVKLLHKLHQQVLPAIEDLLVRLDYKISNSA